jgi:hypothetical protein
VGVSGTSDKAPGVAGFSTSSNGVAGESVEDAGVLGKSDKAVGVAGLSTSSIGVVGESKADNEGFAGVLGKSELGPGVSGTAEVHAQPGVLGENRQGGTGVLGKTTGSGFAYPTIAAVKGISEADAPGLVGESARGPGVVGFAGWSGTAGGLPYGVFGASNTGGGVYGVGSPGVQALGVSAYGVSPRALDVYGDLRATGKSNFLGDVSILGGNLKVVAGSKLFVIDHPLDPEHRYLPHAAVEAPALKTFYDGTITIEQGGHARVTLPEWFAALNTDLCYSLTPLGGPAPDLHIAQEFDGDGFTIGGGRPGTRVCWQVTGVRQDPSAIAAPLLVEEVKEPENIGRYADPAAFGQEPSKNLTWAAQLMATRDEIAERYRNP